MAGIFLDTATISRLCACGADFGFDPISVMYQMFNVI